MDPPGMPILSPSQHGPPMGLSQLGGMDVSVQAANDSQTNRRGGHSGLNLPSIRGHVGEPTRGGMSSSMLLRLSDPQIQDSQAGISPMQLRQMHMMMDAEMGDVSRLTGPGGGLNRAEKPSITNNSDLLKAFTTMSTEQQKSLLSNISSNINSKFVSDGGGDQLPDSRHQSGHSMNSFAPTHMPFPDHHHMLPADVPPPPMVSAPGVSSPGHRGHGALAPAAEHVFARYIKDPNFGSLLAGQRAPASQSGPPRGDHKVPPSIMVDIDVQVNDSSVQNPGSAVSTTTQERVKTMFGGARLSTGSDALPGDPPASPPPKRHRASSDELPKNPNRNMSGVPEWSQAEVDAVMRLYEERGRLAKWKPIADELARMNVDGGLNPALLQKGMIRSNNAVMNKVKEILFKEMGDTPARGDSGEGAPKRITAGVPEWNEVEINTVLELWNKHGRQSEWKSISRELAALNSAGGLNSELAAKGLQRTNNAVMNKVKELSGMARARRSRPRTVGNFALLPTEQGKRSSPGLAHQRSSADASVSVLPDISKPGYGSRDSCDGMELDPHCVDGSLVLPSMHSMSVVSPVRPCSVPPVVVQAVEACAVPAVPHVSPVYGLMHASPVVQQDSDS